MGKQFQPQSLPNCRENIQALQKRENGTGGRFFFVALRLEYDIIGWQHLQGVQFHYVSVDNAL